jgi:hypothetical protein
VPGPGTPVAVCGTAAALVLAAAEVAAAVPFAATSAGTPSRCTFAACFVPSDVNEVRSWSRCLAAERCSMSWSAAGVGAILSPEPVLPAASVELTSGRRRFREPLGCAAGNSPLCLAGAAWLGLLPAVVKSVGRALTAVLCPAAAAAAAAAAGGVFGSSNGAARCSSGWRQRSWQKRRHTWGAAAVV